MRLPKDERKLLKYYYAKERETRENLRFEVHAELMKVLGFDERVKTGKKEFDRVLNANADIKNRGCINLEYEETGLVTNISLTLKGRDLGREYSSKPHTILLWCEEYKFWIILGLIISFVSVLIAILKD